MRDLAIPFREANDLTDRLKELSFLVNLSHHLGSKGASDCDVGMGQDYVKMGNQDPTSYDFGYHPGRVLTQNFLLR